MQKAPFGRPADRGGGSHLPKFRAHTPTPHTSMSTHSRIVSRIGVEHERAMCLAVQAVTAGAVLSTVATADEAFAARQAAP